MWLEDILVRPLCDTEAESPVRSGLPVFPPLFMPLAPGLHFDGRSEALGAYVRL